MLIMLPLSKMSYFFIEIFILLNFSFFLITFGQINSSNKLNSNETEHNNSLIKNDKNNSIRVRVGHIGVANLMPKAKEILEICRKELWKEGILSDEFDIE